MINDLLICLFAESLIGYGDQRSIHFGEKMMNYHAEFIKLVIVWGVNWRCLRDFEVKIDCGYLLIPR